MWIIRHLTAGGSIATSTRSPGNHLLLIENQPDDESIKRTRAPRPSWRHALSADSATTLYSSRCVVCVSDFPNTFPRFHYGLFKLLFFCLEASGALLHSDVNPAGDFHYRGLAFKYPRLLLFFHAAEFVSLDKCLLIFSFWVVFSRFGKYQL